MKTDKLTLKNKTILVTGGAGFIASFLIQRILREFSPVNIINIDCLTDYNPLPLKEWRLREIERLRALYPESNYFFEKVNIADKESIQHVFDTYHPNIVVNLAAQAGVRYSIDHPNSYIESNLIGFYNILEGCRHDDALEHLIYASSSSVYGGNKKIPFSTDDNVDHPVSLYAATKKSNELLAHSYSKIYNIPSTGLRFFTVYGPAGRTDMAYFSFTNKLRKGEKIDIFNYGNCKRDFTYIDDIVEGIVRIMQLPPEKSTGEDGLPIPPYAIYNIGGGQPENLMDFVHILGEELVRVGVLDDKFNVDEYLNLVPMQQGDVPITYADSRTLEKATGFKPEIDLRTGLRHFAEWYKDFYINESNEVYDIVAKFRLYCHDIIFSVNKYKGNVFIDGLVSLSLDERELIEKSEEYKAVLSYFTEVIAHEHVVDYDMSKYEKAKEEYFKIYDPDGIQQGIVYYTYEYYINLIYEDAKEYYRNKYNEALSLEAWKEATDKVGRCTRTIIKQRDPEMKVAKILVDVVFDSKFNGNIDLELINRINSMENGD